MSYKLTESPADPQTERELRKVEAAFTLGVSRQLVAAAVPPAKPGDCMVRVCDGVHWNPIGDGIRRPVWYDAEAQTWKKFS